MATNDWPHDTNENNLRTAALPARASRAGGGGEGEVVRPGPGFKPVMRLKPARPGVRAGHDVSSGHPRRRTRIVPVNRGTMGIRRIVLRSAERLSHRRSRYRYADTALKPGPRFASRGYARPFANRFGPIERRRRRPIAWTLACRPRRPDRSLGHRWPGQWSPPLYGLHGWVSVTRPRLLMSRNTKSGVVRLLRVCCGVIDDRGIRCCHGLPLAVGP